MPLYMIYHAEESETPPPQLLTVNQRHIKLGNESEESVVSHWTGCNSVPVNLSGRTDSSANTGSLCGVTLLGAPSPPNPLFFRLTLCFSLNIFTFPDCGNTVNSDSERASKWGKCVRCMCDVGLELWATQTTLRSSANVNRQQKKNNACQMGGGVQGRGWSFKVGWPPSYGSTVVNNSLSWGAS